jgi:hypothetical protein
MMPDQNRDAASLHGKLVHISCIFPLIQPFLHGIAHFAHCYKSPQSKLLVFLPLHADLSWVCFLIKSLPNKTPLASPEPVDLKWWGDASTSFGIGVVLGSHSASGDGLPVSKLALIRSSTLVGQRQLQLNLDCASPWNRVRLPTLATEAPATLS